MKIYLVRHGKDDESFRGGWSRLGLLEEGRQQAQQLARYFGAGSHLIKTIISSDLPRAAETAGAVAQALQVNVQWDEQWREMNNGLLAGMPHEEAERRFPGVYFSTLRMDTPFPDGESPRHFYRRVTTSFDRLCRRIEEGEAEADVLVVTHGGVISALAYHVNGQEWCNSAVRYPVAHTSVHTLEHLDGRWKLTARNALPHLHENGGNDRP